PKMISINSNEVLEALHEPLAGIVAAIRQALEQTPPELCADVAERGIVLTGGGAMLRDLDRLISAETGLHVQVADDPLTRGARGRGRALARVDLPGNGLFAPADRACLRRPPRPTPRRRRRHPAAAGLPGARHRTDRVRPPRWLAGAAARAGDGGDAAAVVAGGPAVADRRGDQRQRLDPHASGRREPR